MRRQLSITCALFLLASSCGKDNHSVPAADAGPDVSTTQLDAHTSMDGNAGPDDGSMPADDTGSTPDMASTPDGGPTGTGIAARYPGDEGIDADPDVIFADDFESYQDADDLWDRWFNAFGNLEITRDSATVLEGAQALQMTLPSQNNELSNGVQQEVSPELDVLFLRWHQKIDTNFDIVGSSHNGGGISAHYHNGFMSTPGIPADGTNKFLIEYECWRGQASEPNPGNLNVYIYHPGQRDNYGDHFFPNGEVLPNTSIPGDFGPDFVPRPNVVPELGRWHAYEVMLKANTPGQTDGQITMWLDGEIIGDFPNLRLRDVATLTIDRFGVGFHAGSNPNGETQKWVDNVVAARSYIGPLVR